MLNLTNLQEGETASVISLLNGSRMKRRLQDLGLIEGTQIQCIQKSPYGDPVAYEIRGAIIALRTEDAINVLIDQEQCRERGKIF
ncbi:FeoA family protein [Kineothrix sp. MB12-C1]|uniref:FeoA family protein n=1 Tax=Kineothrix sp. MB12-C1 TaxID=3070215 RepID=UPI0027D26A5D|nr:FeoA family protein [Kineothrix sp. MB12-C1]WMC94209.1 FeoA family protein [Kineothrix sp. MB12-C1]